MARQPGKPPNGSPEHRAWVLGLLEEYARQIAPLHPTYKGFVAYEKSERDKTGRPSATTRDVTAAGGFVDLRARVIRALAERSKKFDVDFSDLDFDDDAGDTAKDARTLHQEADRRYRDRTRGGPAAAATSAHEADSSPVIVTPTRAPARPAEPREVLAERKAKAAKVEAERKVKRLAEELEHAEARGELLDALGHSGPLRPIKPREPTSGLREAAAFVACSDWHVEEVVHPAAVEYRNAYNPAIAMHRIERLLMGILWLVNMHRERFSIRDLVLWLGGDLLSGYLHEELEETNSMAPPEAVVWLQRAIAGMIQTLLDRGEFERIIIPCNTGNHGRTTRRKRFKTSVKNSYEYIVYCYLADHFRDEPRVEFEIAKGGHIYLPVYSTDMRLHHGDDVRYWGGVGGLSIPLNKATAAWQKFKPADLTVIGHFHQLLHGRDWIVNGSLIGYNEFALGIKAEFEPPQQAFFLVDKHRGRTCASPIWVEEREIDWRTAWAKYGGSDE